MIRALAIWGAVALAVGVPLWVAGQSPLLAWRDTVYVVAGGAGVFGLALLLLQPLLVAGRLPGLAGARGRRVHQVLGAALVAAIVVHVGGLWLTSPPDVIDALTFRSPTPFSAWGVVAMAAAFGAALLALLRRRLPLRLWRLGHTGLVGLVVVATVVHAVLIEGTMGAVSKVVLCALVLLAFGVAVRDRRVLRLLRPRA